MSAPSIWTRLRHSLGSYPRTAHDWAIRVRSEDVTRRELLALEDWLRADPKNAENYAQVAKIGHLGLRLRDLPEARSRLRRMAPPARPIAPHSTFSPMRIALGATTCAAVLAGVALVPRLIPGEERYASQLGEQRQVALSDGSRMMVNTASEATVAFSPSERTVRLGKGEAFFEVAKDAARPFVVRTATADVRAVGTKFSVRYDNGQTYVVVTEGRVKVASHEPTDASGTVEVAPGNKATVSDAAPLHVAAVNAVRETAWTSGNVEFEDTPLAEVLAELNRYTRKPFVLEDPALQDVRLTGRFRVGDSESVKYVLRGRFDVTAAEDATSIHLSRGH